MHLSIYIYMYIHIYIQIYLSLSPYLPPSLPSPVLASCGALSLSVGTVPLSVQSSIPPCGNLLLLKQAGQKRLSKPCSIARLMLG